MKSILTFIIAILAITSLSSCSQNYSNGNRVGFLTKFSKKGVIWKSWEGELNLTQTGMNTSSTFGFSIDNDNEDSELVKKLDSAATYGWKVELTYHEVLGFNWFSNRGHEDYFVTNVKVLDRSPLLFGNKFSDSTRSGKVIDTIYVVIVPKK